MDLDKIISALTDPKAPWYGSDLVEWIADLIDEYKKQKVKIKKLEAALKHSINLIKQWHCMGMPEEQAEKTWELYKNNAPEMKDIEQALKCPDY